MKSKLIDEIVGELSGCGYSVADCAGTQSCFDVLARKGGRTFVIKVLANVEGLSVSCSRDFRRVASLLSATPVVVCERMKSSRLSRGVVYERHGLHVVSGTTFRDFLNDAAPHVHSVRGNYCVRVDPLQLRRLRASRGLTQDEVAGRIGVSKQSIYRYESNGRVLLEVAEKLQQLLGVEWLSEEDTLVSEPAESGDPENVLTHLTGLKRDVADAFRGIGFKTSITNAPFDMVVAERECVYTAVSDDWRRLERKIEIVDRVGEIMDGYSLCITRRRVKDHKNVMKPAELHEIKSARELMERLG